MLASQPAMADFWGKNTPDWSGNAYYTNQTWTFTDEVAWDSAGHIDPAVKPDNGYVNPNNTPSFYSTGYTVDFFGGWGWKDEGPMWPLDWKGVQGMLGGMGTGHFDFYAPIADVQGTTSVWVQYVSFIPEGSDGSAVGALIGFDSKFTSSRASDSKSWEKIPELVDQGSSGDWWRITETWEIENAGDLLYLRVNADVPGTSNMVDSVQVMTKATVQIKQATPCCYKSNGH